MVRWNVGPVSHPFPRIQFKKIFDYSVVLHKQKSKSREICFFFVFLSLIELALMLPFHWMIKHKNNAKETIYRSDFVDSQINETEEIRRKKDEREKKYTTKM